MGSVELEVHEVLFMPGPEVSEEMAPAAPLYQPGSSDLRHAQLPCLKRDFALSILIAAGKSLNEDGEVVLSADALTARNELVSTYSYLPSQVMRGLRSYCPKEVSFEDLCQAGAVELIKVAERYDPGFGAPFESFARCRVRGAILDALRVENASYGGRRGRLLLARVSKLSWDQFQRTGRYPSYEQISSLLYEQDLALLARKLGREPSLKDIIDRKLRRYPPRVLEGLEVQCSRPLSLEAEHVGGPPLFETLADKGPSGDPQRLTEVNSTASWLRRGLSGIPRKEARVLGMYFGISDKGAETKSFTLAEIGDALGFTESRACQIKESGLKRLGTRLNLMGIQASLVSRPGRHPITQPFPGF